MSFLTSYDNDDYIPSSSSSPFTMKNIFGVSADEMPSGTRLRNGSKFGTHYESHDNDYVCMKKKNTGEKHWEKCSNKSRTRMPKVIFQPSSKDEFDELEDEFWSNYSPEAPQKIGRPTVYNKKFSRAPTEYNIFMKEKMQEIRENGNNIAPSNVFKSAAASWKEHKQNKK